MRISTKLALLAGFSVISIFGIIAGTARADESNQTKINLNLTENILTMGLVKVCEAQEPTPSVPVEEEKKEEEIKKVEKITIQTKKQVATDSLPKGKFIINASAYTAAADECGKSDGITASGKMVKENETIACPKNFAFGTKINIEGYGIYTCFDRGGAIKGNKIDIYMKTKAQAFAFGRRNLVAEVVTE